VELDEMPAIVGRPIKGTITLNDGGIPFPDELTLQLLCRNAGTKKGSTQVGPDAEAEAMWKEKQTLSVPVSDPEGNVELRFEFKPPDDLPSAEIKNTVPKVAWTLRLKDIYNKRMYDYAIDLPVFRSDDPVLSE
jgi:hypothetical protein